MKILTFMLFMIIIIEMVYKVSDHIIGWCYRKNKFNQLKAKSFYELAIEGGGTKDGVYECSILNYTGDHTDMMIRLYAFTEYLKENGILYEVTNRFTHSRDYDLVSRWGESVYYGKSRRNYNEYPLVVRFWIPNE